MPTLNKIVIHIGAPKTGSTYIQKRLRNAQNMRSDHGVYYPILPIIQNMAGNAKLLPIAIDKRASQLFKHVYTNINISNLDPAMIMHAFTEQWHRTKETMILSAENMRSHHADTLRELLPYDANIRIVLFIRNQIDWFESYYNQLAKTNETSKRISSFIDDLCENKPPGLLFPDWNALYDAFFSVFGHCEVLVYEQVKSDLLGAFCHAADLSSVSGIPDISRIQTSIPAEQIAYLLSIGDKKSKTEFFRHKTASTKALNDIEGKTMNFLSPDDCEKIRDHFQDGNDKLITKLERAYPSLELKVITETRNYCDLGKLYQSQDYINYQDQIKKYLP